MKNVQAFIDLNKDVITDALKGTKLFPSVLMAQLIQESSGQYGNYGLSYLAHQYHNYGGIVKWSGFTGDSVRMKTGEYTEGGKPYTRYANFIVCKNFADFCKWRVVFLTKNSRYQKAGVFDAVTPEAQIAALKKAGYATDPQYTARVTSHISSYNLKQLDEYLKKKLVDVQVAVLPPVSTNLGNVFKRLFQIKKIFFPVDSGKVYIDESVKVDVQQ